MNIIKDAVENPLEQPIRTINDDAVVQAFISQTSYDRVIEEIMATSNYVQLGQGHNVPTIQVAKRMIDVYRLFPGSTNLKRITEGYDNDVIQALVQTYGKPDHPVNQIIRLNADNDENRAGLMKVFVDLQAKGISLGRRQYSEDAIVDAYYKVLNTAKDEFDDETFDLLPSGLRSTARIALLSRQYRKNVLQGDKTESEQKAIEDGLRFRLSRLRGFGYKKLGEN